MPSQSPTGRLKHSIPFLTAIAAIAVLTIFSGLVAVRYHGDEGAYLNDSIWFDQWLSADFGSLRRLSDQKLLEAPVVPLLAGLSRNLIGEHLTQRYAWDFSVTGDQAIPRSVTPTASVLLAGRLPSALLTFGGVMLLTALILQQLGYLASTLVSAMILLNPGLMDALRQVMTESSLLFFSVLSLVLCARAVSLLSKHGRRGRVLPLLILAGIAIGFSTASKHNGATTLAAGALMAVCALVANRLAPSMPSPHEAGRILLRAGSVALLLAAIAASVFIALNPFAWDNPFKAVAAVINQRNQLSASQQQHWPANALVTLDQRISTGIWRVFTQDATLGCDPRDSGLIVMNTMTNSFHWVKPTASTPLSRSVLCASTAPWSEPVRLITLLNILLSGLGIVTILARQVRGLRAKGSILPVTTLLVWGATLDIPVLLLSPMNWSRYYLLPVTLTSIWAGIGLAFLVCAIARPLLQRSFPSA